jgi:hypothetical protein
MSAQQPFTYITYFENIFRDGSIAAQIVDVVDYLDPVTLDPATVTLGPIRFGDKVVEPTPVTNPPIGQRQFYYEVPLPERNLTVRITATLDMLIGELTWRYMACDAAGNCPPLDAFLGFLPPNQTSPEGEGSVTVSILPRAGLPTGTVAQVRAKITFDPHFELPFISPDPWFNTIDGDKPVSQVQALAATQPVISFPVQWQVSDVGSGVDKLSIYVSDNGGPFTLWLSNPTETQAVFNGEIGHAYAFYAIARDNAGNVEDIPALPDTATTVSGVSLSGTLTLENCASAAQPITFTLRPTAGGQTFSRTVTPAANGTYTLANIPGANYTVHIKGMKWLAKNLSVNCTSGDVSGLNLTLLGGDANNDNIVDLEDLAAFIEAFDADPVAANWNDGVADFNCDNVVSVDDLDILIRNFDAEGDQ